MSNTHITKNYFAHGGDELVIGGKLTILEDAVVEGLEEGGSGSAPEFVPTVYLADSDATTIAGLKEDFNELLAALRSANILLSVAPVNAS